MSVRALHFWVVGGDRRQGALAELLAEEGHTVHTFALPAGEPRGSLLPAEELKGIERADCVVLPLPATGKEGFVNTPLWEGRLSPEEVFAAMGRGRLVTGGRLEPGTVRQAGERGLVCRDYFAREELAVLNAVPTAEGALQLAMEHLPITLHGCRALILGYGRIGRALARDLLGLGAFVTVGARRYSQLALAETEGCTARRLAELTGWLCGYDVIFNTVPAPVLDRAMLADLKPGCPVIDLASEPGGVDLPAAAELGIPVLRALSLPGKVAPVTAARAIRQTVYHMLQEEGVI